MPCVIVVRASFWRPEEVGLQVTSEELQVWLSSYEGVERPRVVLVITNNSNNLLAILSSLQ